MRCVVGVGAVEPDSITAVGVYPTSHPWGQSNLGLLALVFLPIQDDVQPTQSLFISMVSLQVTGYGAGCKCNRVRSAPLYVAILVA